MTTQKNHNLIPAITSGAINTFLLSCPDRIMFLAQINHNPVTHQIKLFWQNIINISKKEGSRAPSLIARELFPSGVFGAVSRVYTNSTYYICQGVAADYLLTKKEKNDLSDTSINIIKGVTAGSINAVIFSTPVSTLRYISFSHNHKPILDIAKNMYKQGGAKIFYSGLVACLIRDAIFGVIYEVLRKSTADQLRQYKYFNDRSCKSTGDFIGASLAVAACSPFNYIRNMKCKFLFDNSDKSSYEYLKSLYKYTMHGFSKDDSTTIFARLSRLQQRLVLNAAIIRVAIGFAIGQAVFDYIKEKQDNIKIKKTVRPVLSYWQRQIHGANTKDIKSVDNHSYLKHSPFESTI